MRGLEALQRLRDYFLNKTKEMSFQDLRDIEKELIALYIIKTKKVYIRDILACEDFKEYNMECAYEEDWLDNDEFTLLKEMFS